MKVPARTRFWLWKVIKYVLIIELVYVVLINALLFLPLTQTVINKIKPEKFNVTWEKAWTFYPGRVHVRNASADGNARTQIWQVEVGSASGSIALLPLILKRVWVDDVSGSDIRFHMRPRPKPDRDYSRIEEYFPVIEGREVTPAVTTPRKKKRPWYISVEDIHVGGPLEYWIYNVRGSAGGEARANLDYVSPGGELTLDVFDFALDLGTHYVNGNNEMFPEGRISGSMGFSPFVPRENKGLPMLQFLLVDAAIDIDVNSLKFVKLFVLNFPELDIDGTGKVNGRLRYREGEVLEGTDLAIDARDLLVGVLAHRILGRGDIDLERGESTGGQLDIGFRFRDLEVVHDGDDSPMLTGENLELHVGGDGNVLPDPEKINESRVIGLEIDQLQVPDLALFQRYLPDKWPFRLYGGEGSLGGTMRLTPFALNVDLALNSDAAEMGIAQYRFETDLDAALKLDNPAIMSNPTRVAGSFVRLSKAHLLREGQKDEQPWSASLTLKEGEFHLLGKKDRDDADDVKDLFRLLGDSEARALLAESGGLFDFEAEVSSLAWISAFLGAEYKSQFHGSSTIGGQLALEGGLPAPGTDVAVRSEELVVNILDYVSRGDGVIALEVEEGGEAPDWRFRLDLSGAELRRRGDEEAYVHDVEMRLDALVEDVDFDRSKQKEFALDFGIDSARVTDMSVFNRYLPPDSPVRFTGGEADLAADIVLLPADADGWVRLDSSGLNAAADGQELRADLAAEVLLVGGIPAEMNFDVTGSSLLLDNVHVEGEEADFDEKAWSAKLDIEHGVVTLADPIMLDAKAAISISDSRPVVALFRNQDGWRPEFLANMMTLEDIEGTGEVQMAGNRTVIPYAHVISDNAEAGLKAVMEGERSDGVIYFRYKKLDALLKVRDGKRNLDIIKAREKYDEYEPSLQ